MKGVTVFGHLNNEVQINQYELVNSKGVIVKVINYGAIITDLIIHDGENATNIVLGFDTLDSYLQLDQQPNAPYIGAVIGRTAGRIKNGELHIAGKTIQLHKLEQNNLKFSLIQFDVSIV